MTYRKICACMFKGFINFQVKKIMKHKPKYSGFKKLF